MEQPYNGPDRRRPAITGKEGRRISDMRCHEHDVLWAHHDKDTADHRAFACNKIAALERYHDRDLDGVRIVLKEKAEKSDVRGMGKLVAILITVCCLVVAGQAVWLKGDIGKTDDSIKSGFLELKKNISENAEDRIEAIDRVNTRLSAIERAQEVSTWRLTQIEIKIKAGP